MPLRDVLVYAGIVNSKRVCALPPAVQLFFRNLLHACDGAARFEADVEQLRTDLYGRVLSRVSKGDVSRWLVACQQAELITLYTRDGRGYGEIYNYRQRDTKRRVLYPGPEEDTLFSEPATEDPPPSYSQSAPPPDSSRAAPRNGSEGKSPQPPAAAGGDVAKAIAARKAGRQYRDSKRAAEELERVETELTDLLHPGGSAWKVTPTGAKLDRYTVLMARRAELLRMVETEERRAS